MSPTNPLLTERFPIPFDAIEASHVAPAVQELLADADARLKALEGYDGALTFDSVMLALEAITERLGWAMRIVGHLEGVATTKALRDAYNEAQPKVSAFESRIPLSAPLWDLLKRYAETAEAEALEGPQRRFLDKSLAYFRRHGAELGDADKERLAELDVELTKRTLRYAQNTLDATNAYELIVTDEARLAGLPDSAREAARESARGKGREGWRFTLQIPSYIAAMTYLDDATIREQIYRAMSSRASSGEYDNRELVMQIIRLRREKASLLGYDTFADLVLEERMANSGAEARAFVEDLRKRTRPHFEREREDLLAFRRELEGDDAPPLQPWDTAYYAEKLRQKLYSFEEEKLKPYFGFKRVLSGIFDIASRIYGIRLEPWEEAPGWDESVTAYRVLDQRDDRWLAVIYVDPFPRETKQGGAWMDGLVSRARGDDDSRQVAALVANMTPPVGGKDALLSHRDVETLFHEFGHILHHCLSRAVLRSQAGTNVAWDFVELPSQIFENWCWEREALDLFARHHETDEPIPEDLFQAMKRARTFRAATGQMRQLGFAVIDLALHTDFDPDTDGDAIDYSRALLQQYFPDPLPESHAMIASFSHLFADPVGYAAGYYSYKWAEVLDADAFTRFKKEGLLNPEVGQAFRETILERGDEEDPAVLFRRFMGRDPELGALLERLGIAA